MKVSVSKYYDDNYYDCGEKVLLHHSNIYHHYGFRQKLKSTHGDIYHHYIYTRWKDAIILVVVLVIIIVVVVIIT